MPGGIHDILMGRGRAQQRRAQARPASYRTPAGDGPALDCLAVWTAAADVPIDGADPTQRRTEVEVLVQISPSATGALADVQRGGHFLLDAFDAGAPQSWVVEEFLQSDAGWRRCLCVRQQLQAGRVIGRPNR